MRSWIKQTVCCQYSFILGGGVVVLEQTRHGLEPTLIIIGVEQSACWLCLKTLGPIEVGVVRKQLPLIIQTLISAERIAKVVLGTTGICL